MLLPPLASGGSRPAVSIAGESLRYDELAGAAGGVAAGVAGADRIAVHATPTLDTVVAVVGALAAGVAVVPVNPASGERELAHVIADSRPDLVVASRDAVLPAPLAALPRVSPRSTGAPYRDRSAGDDERTALIIYTSGTTGPPKGVQLSRRAIASNLDALADAWRWDGGDVLVQALPLFHVHGLVLGILGPLRRGGRVVHPGRFSPAAIVTALERGATLVFGVPTMYRRLADAAETDPSAARALAAARLLVSGSAALPLAEHRRLEQLTGRRIVERYGMTETLMNTAVRADDESVPGSVGRPVAGVELRLLDEDGRPLDPGDPALGEVALRGPNLFTGYLNLPEATAAAFRDGWFVTGDIATRDGEGALRLVGRRSIDLIKSGGYKIGAGEIESALLEHPAVVEAAVKGLPDEDLGERVAAWIVRRPGTQPTGEELAEHTARLLAPHKRPREIRFVDELPRNALGKVVKADLP